MPDDPFKKLDIADPKIFEAIKDRLREIFLFNEVSEAYFFFRNITRLLTERPDLKKKDPEKFQEYEDLAIKAGFVAIDRLEEKEILDLIEKHLSVIFSIDEFFNIWDKIRGRLIFMNFPEDRDAFKAKIREAMRRNEEPLTREKITTSGLVHSATISNWLADYTANLGVGIVDKVKRREYLINNENIKKLSEEEKGKVKKILDFYERLKLSSLTPEGLEEYVPIVQDGKLKVLREGVLEDVETPELSKIIKQVTALWQRIQTPGAKAKEKGPAPGPGEVPGAGPAPGPTQIFKAYLGDPAEQKAIAAEEELMRKNLGADFRKIASLLYETAFPPAGGRPPKIRLVASLRVLAKMGRLEELLVQDARFREFLVASLKKQGQERLLEGFTLQPTAPEYLKLFLKYLLKERGGLDENESARFGLQIANIFRKRGGEKLSRLGYYDETIGEFRWN